MIYVTMTDHFLSGWGMAVGKLNKLVLECETFEEAERVFRYSKSHVSMKYVSISRKKPKYDERKFVTTVHNKADYPIFYEERQIKGGKENV